MCGIAGKLTLRRGETVSQALLENMCNTIAHRGPDDAGYYTNGCIGLGHRRLSIIDVDAGHQPISNEDGTVWVVFNGEIYNYIELRDSLIAKGHRFRTSTDTEVIVHLYEEQGDQFVTALRGMFAIALWDDRHKQLILARDRVGKKPLYYAHNPESGLVFGSEIKAILQDPEISRALEVQALDAYLSLLYVPHTLSMFKGIKKLPPAHILICSQDKVVIKEYWDLIFQVQGERTLNDYLEELEQVFNEAVKVRLRSDVPLGAFLSGGIDSSYVVRSMSKQLSRPVVTCAVGFAEKAHNELPFARRVAQRLGCTHYEHVISPNIRDVIPKLVRFFDEPFADSSAVPTYYVSQMARQHVTVALSGDGGDELFAGYSRHALQRLEAKVRRLVTPPGARLLKQVGQYLPNMRGKNTLKKLAMTPDRSYAFKHCGFLFNEEAKEKLYDDGLHAACHDFDVMSPFQMYYERCLTDDPLDKALYVDIKTYLPDDILVKVDRMSMAHALEVRAPLLDHKVLEFSATIPSALKLRGRTTKSLLKEALAGDIPEEILTRKKHGFTMPLAEWLRKDLREIVEDCLFSPRAVQRGLFQTPTVTKLWNDHLSKQIDYSAHIWLLMMFELWHREYLDNHVQY